MERELELNSVRVVYEQLPQRRGRHDVLAIVQAVFLELRLEAAIALAHDRHVVDGGRAGLHRTIGFLRRIARVHVNDRVGIRLRGLEPCAGETDRRPIGQDHAEHLGIEAHGRLEIGGLDGSVKEFAEQHGLPPFSESREDLHQWTQYLHRLLEQPGVELVRQQVGTVVDDELQLLG